MSSISELEAELNCARATLRSAKEKVEYLICTSNFSIVYTETPGYPDEEIQAARDAHDREMYDASEAVNIAAEVVYHISERFNKAIIAKTWMAFSQLFGIDA